MKHRSLSAAALSVEINSAGESEYLLEKFYMLCLCYKNLVFETDVIRLKINRQHE